MKLLAIIAALTLCACTNETASLRALKGAGLHNVSLTGYSFFGCGEGDFTHDSFSADNASGERVEGVVCCGIFKGCTVRYD